MNNKPRKTGPLQRVRIKDFKNITIGFTEEKSDGRVVATDFYGRKLGEYDPNSDTTRDFYGKIVAHGNHVDMLVYRGYQGKPDAK